MKKEKKKKKQRKKNDQTLQSMINNIILAKKILGYWGPYVHFQSLKAKLQEIFTNWLEYFLIDDFLNIENKKQTYIIFKW